MPAPTGESSALPTPTPTASLQTTSALESGGGEGEFGKFGSKMGMGTIFELHRRCTGQAAGRDPTGAQAGGLKR